MPRTSDARQKALKTAERLFRVQGYVATGLAQILAESGAPKGSFYFHFPGGKEQLALEVLEHYGQQVEAWIRSLSARGWPDATGFVTAICAGIAEEMRASGWRLGCVAQNLATELAPDHARFHELLRRVFDGWESAIASGFIATGVAPGAAADAASALLSALEGARSLARVKQTTMPFDAIARQFTR